jgi:hypothetical protein
MKDKAEKNGIMRDFLEGFRSAFDISGSSAPDFDFDNGFREDREALQGDWARVGGDLRRAMDTVAHAR